MKLEKKRGRQKGCERKEGVGVGVGIYDMKMGWRMEIEIRRESRSRSHNYIYGSQVLKFKFSQQFHLRIEALSRHV